VGCVVDENDESEWALVIPKGMASLSTVNISEIELLGRVRMAIQIAQGIILTFILFLLSYSSILFFHLI
jgi:hypothetical protein